MKKWVVVWGYLTMDNDSYAGAYILSLLTKIDPIYNNDQNYWVVNIIAGLKCCGEFIHVVTWSTVRVLNEIWKFICCQKKTRNQTISAFLWPPRIRSNIEAKFSFWCPKLKERKSVLTKIFSLGKLLTISGRITLEITHGIYSFQGRRLAAYNIFPCGMCSIIFADIY